MESTRISLLGPIEFSESQIANLDEAMNEGDNTLSGGHRNLSLSSPYKNEYNPTSLEEAIKELEFYRRRMVQRMEIIDALRRAYLKDVVTVRTEHFQLLCELNNTAGPWSNLKSNQDEESQGDPTAGEDITVASASELASLANVTGYNNYRVSENMRHNVPSLDFRDFLQLHAPAESFLVVKKCPCCGGHLEVIKHESKKIKRLTAETEALKQNEKVAQQRERDLRIELAECKAKLGGHLERNKMDQEMMNRKVLELKEQLKQRVSKDELDRVLQQVQTERKKYQHYVREMEVIPEFRTKIAKMEESIKRLETEIYRGKFNLKTMKTEKEQLEQEFRKSTDANTACEKKLADTTEELKKANTEKQELEKSLGDAKARIEKLEKYIENMSSNANTNQVNFYQLEQELRDSLEQEELRSEELDRKLDDAKQQIRSLMKELGAMRGKGGATGTRKLNDAVEEMFLLESADSGDQGARPESPDQEKKGRRRRKVRDPDALGGMRGKSTSRPASPDDQIQLSEENNDALGGISSKRLSSLAMASRKASAIRRASRRPSSLIQPPDEEIDLLKREVDDNTKRIDEEILNHGEAPSKLIKQHLKKLKILIKTYDRKLKTEVNGKTELYERLEHMDKEIIKRKDETSKLYSLIDPEVLEKNKLIFVYDQQNAQQGQEKKTSASKGQKSESANIVRVKEEREIPALPSVNFDGSEAAGILALLSEKQLTALRTNQMLLTEEEMDERLREQEEQLAQEYEDQANAFRAELEVVNEEKRKAEEEAKNVRLNLLELTHNYENMKEEMENLRRKFATESSSTNLAAQKMANDVGSLRMDYEIAITSLNKVNEEVKAYKERCETSEKITKKVRKEMKELVEQKEVLANQVGGQAKSIARTLLSTKSAIVQIHKSCSHSKLPPSDRNRSVAVIQVDKIMRLLQQGNEGTEEARLEELMIMLGSQDPEGLVAYTEEMSTEALTHVNLEVQSLLSQCNDTKAKLQHELEEAIREYEKKIASLEKIILKATTDMEHMRNSNLREVAMLKELQAGYRQKIDELEGTINFQKSQVQASEILKVKCGELQRDIGKMRKQITELERKVNDLEFTNETLEMTLHNTNVDFTAAKTELAKLKAELKDSQKRVKQLEKDYLEASTELKRIIDADKLRLATNVSIGLDVKPSHFTINKEVQTEFVTPEMTLRQVNHYLKYPFQSSGSTFVKAQVKHADPPLWSFRSEYSVTKGGTGPQHDQSQRPWTDGSLLGSLNQETSMMSSFSESQLRPFTAQESPTKPMYAGLQKGLRNFANSTKDLKRDSFDPVVAAGKSGLGRISAEISLPTLPSKFGGFSIPEEHTPIPSKASFPQVTFSR